MTGLQGTSGGLRGNLQFSWLDCTPFFSSYSAVPSFCNNIGRETVEENLFWSFQDKTIFCRFQNLNFFVLTSYSRFGIHYIYVSFKFMLRQQNNNLRLAHYKTHLVFYSLAETLFPATTNWCFRLAVKDRPKTGRTKSAKSSPWLDSVSWAFSFCFCYNSSWNQLQSGINPLKKRQRLLRLS